MEEAACRQLVSRARAHIERGQVRHVTPIATQDQLLRAFEAAITSGNTAQLTEMLSSDIRLTTDSGGKASAVLRVLEGEEVLLVLKRAHGWWKGCSFDAIHLATVELLDEPPPLVTIVTRDERIRSNARALGYAID
jgi:hypothetical protein